VLSHKDFDSREAFDAALIERIDGYQPALVVLPVLPGDTAEALAARVLLQEHLLYPQAIRDWLQESH